MTLRQILGMAALAAYLGSHEGAHATPADEEVVITSAAYREREPGMHEYDLLPTVFPPANLAAEVEWLAPSGQRVAFVPETSVGDAIREAWTSGFVAAYLVSTPSLPDGVYVERVLIRSEMSGSEGRNRTISREERFFSVVNGVWTEISRDLYGALTISSAWELDEAGQWVRVVRGGGLAVKRTLEETLRLPHGEDLKVHFDDPPSGSSPAHRGSDTATPVP